MRWERSEGGEGESAAKAAVDEGKREKKGNRGKQARSLIGLSVYRLSKEDRREKKGETELRSVRKSRPGVPREGSLTCRQRRR